MWCTILGCPFIFKLKWGLLTKGLHIRVIKEWAFQQGSPRTSVWWLFSHLLDASREPFSLLTGCQCAWYSRRRGREGGTAPQFITKANPFLHCAWISWVWNLSASISPENKLLFSCEGAGNIGYLHVQVGIGSPGVQLTFQPCASPLSTTSYLHWASQRFCWGKMACFSLYRPLVCYLHSGTLVITVAPSLFSLTLWINTLFISLLLF